MNEQRTNGIVVGLVTSLEDKDGLGRVTVSFPHLDQSESNFARLVSLMAGKDRGSVFVPEVGDEVLVAFEQGDIRRPYILGGVWSQPDPPPKGDGKPKDNNWRFFKSRSGHIFLFDDTSGKERIVLVDKDDKRRVVIDSAKAMIQVVCDQGDVEVSAPMGSVTIKAKTITLEATDTITLDGKVTANLKGGMVNIN